LRRCVSLPTGTCLRVRVLRRDVGGGFAVLSQAAISRLEIPRGLTGGSAPRPRFTLPDNVSAGIFVIPAPKINHRDVDVFDAEISRLVLQPLASCVRGRAVVGCFLTPTASARRVARDNAVRRAVVVRRERFDLGPKTTAFTHASNLPMKNSETRPKRPRPMRTLSAPTWCTREAILWSISFRSSPDTPRRNELAYAPRSVLPAPIAAAKEARCMSTTPDYYRLTCAGCGHV
jgi:hypothetical protein